MGDEIGSRDQLPDAPANEAPSSNSATHHKMLTLATSAFAYTPGLQRSACVRMAAGDMATRRQFLHTAAATAALTAASPAYAAGKNGVSFTNVKNGDTISPEFTFKFDVTGYELSPAAAGLKDASGHHHVIIDGPGDSFPQGEAIPFDDTHKHYGKAQTEGTLALEPGKHKITLQFANALHESYGKEFAKTITVNVKA